ncbi:hypothetical protein Anapl_12426 [Anas platyrhynchos]|uniref:Uncharacterized protein n=1 Tax=Anas platyrhynchos TaxID=8839 RepID=R0L3N6_ANAPL|nr:hypothetical protein Anapl_12426 [Anas platyrhynchos]
MPRKSRSLIAETHGDGAERGQGIAAAGSGAVQDTSLLGGELGSCSGFVRGAAEPCLSEHKAPQLRSDTSSGDSSEKREWKEEPRSVRGPRGCDSHHAV